jgi:hypothetical protein
VAAYGAKGPNGRIDASGKVLFGAELELARQGGEAGHLSIIGGPSGRTTALS